MSERSSSEDTREAGTPPFVTLLPSAARASIGFYTFIISPTLEIHLSALVADN